jgi:hypothetical protein
MGSTLDDLSKRQTRKSCLLDRFVYATLEVEHPLSAHHLIHPFLLTSCDLCDDDFINRLNNCDSVFILSSNHSQEIISASNEQLNNF